MTLYDEFEFPRVLGGTTTVLLPILEELAPLPEEDDQ